jgi:putative ABC transport system ATP-binding protein
MSGIDLELRGVCVRFHEGTDAEVRAVLDVSLVVRRGAFVGVSGPSGCGKTTLLAVLGAMQRPTAGTVLVDGRDLADASEAERSRLRRRLGFAFQTAPMLRALPLWENVTYGLVARGESVSRRRTLGSDLLERVGLGAKIRAVPEELSGGERQRAALARALAGGPDALLVDEPTSGLDRAAAALVIDLVAGFHAGGGTVVVASHDAAALERAGDRVVLEAGRVTDMRFASGASQP